MEMWDQRLMERKTNKKVLDIAIGENRSLIEIIKMHRFKMIGHTIRHLKELEKGRWKQKGRNNLGTPLQDN